MILKHSPKRCCIYFIYDKNGIVDDYILYQLKDMRKNVAHLHCVINGRITPESKKKLLDLADDVYVRDNTGFDFGAYKAAIEYIGWNNVATFDEIILMNYTCFGPIYPFSECFEWANEQDVDFWGITMGLCEMHNFPEEFSQYSFGREHIQSYFIAIRNSLLKSKEFKEFVNSRPEIKSYSESGLYYENTFTNYFRIRGFEFKTYCDCTELLKYHNYPLMIFPGKLIKQHRCPVFKIKTFTESYTDLLTQCVGEPAQEIFDFLNETKLYDTDLIWQHLLRTQDLSVLLRNCHLVRIMPRDVTLPQSNNLLTVGVVFHAYYSDLFSESIESLCSFSKNTEFLITTDTEEKQKRFTELFSGCGYKFEVHVINNRGRDMSALLVEAKSFVEKFDLICFSHDKKTSQQQPGSVGLSWSYELTQNMFATADYVKNVVNLFSQEPKLGIAFPPYPVHNDYSGLGTGWVSNYDSTRRLLDEFEIKAPTNPQRLCIAPLGTNFWFRSKALKKIFNIGWGYKDFPREPIITDGTLLHALERTFSYVAQDAGYYPAFIMNDVYARIEHINLDLLRVGSQQMYSYLHIAQMEEVFSKPAKKITGQEIAEYVPTQQEILAYHVANMNYGVKACLKQLAIALRFKYPRFWKFMYPFRKIGKKLLRIN